MGVAETTIQGVRARIFRISFSGELAYEINVPAGYGEAVWELLMAAGAAFDIVPYGMEALGVLRIEKGHVAGPELDGRTTARDLRPRPHAQHAQSLHRPEADGAARPGRSRGRLWSG